MKGQKGLAYTMVLAVLAIGSFLLIPGLFFMSTSSIASRNAVLQAREGYASDGGVEHALWRLRYEAGFASSLNQTTPTTSYSVTLNGTQTDVTVHYLYTDPPPPAPGSSSDRITVNKTVDPPSIPPLVTTIVTYTIIVENIGTSKVHLEAVGDNLPQYFHYIPGTSSGFTTAEPTMTIVDGKEVLEWSFSSPLPEVPSGQTRTQTFQAEATPDWGVYYNEGWVVASPASIGYVSSGGAAPVGVGGGSTYNIFSTANGVTVQARISITAGGNISIYSWQVVK